SVCRRSTLPSRHHFFVHLSSKNPTVYAFLMPAPTLPTADAHRTASVERKTHETDISLSVDLDGSGESKIATPIGFLTHMLETFSRHSLVDVTATVAGDLHVDQHHTVEDTGMVLGQAVAKALGERRGISRAGWARHPMDEALA